MIEQSDSLEQNTCELAVIIYSYQQSSNNKISMKRRQCFSTQQNLISLNV